MIKPEFTPRIDFGHLIQAGILLATLGAGGIGGWLSLDSRITDGARALAVTQQEVLQQGRVLEQLRDDQRRFSESISGSLGRLSEQIADLRVLVASGKTGPHVR